VNDIEALREVCTLCAAAGGFALLIFGLGSRSLPSGFHIFPSSAQAWIAFWFHTLEFLVSCCCIVAWHSGFPRLQPAGAMPVVHLLLSLSALLLLSVIVFWRRGRPCSRAGLVWVAIAVLTGFLIPVASATKTV